MKNLKVRELILDIAEVDETRNPFAIALKMVKALHNKEISLEDFELLSGELQFWCVRFKIETSNEICSLF